jgi:hypothetical protein
MYAQRSSILALIAAGAIAIAVNSAPALAKDGHTTVSNGSPSHNNCCTSQSSGSSQKTATNHDHDHDHDWDKKKWYHHHHDGYYEHHYDRYVPTEQVRPYVVVRPVTPDNCLTKEYLEPDTVLFKDVCTKQWAKNSTSIPTRAASADAKCLRKENLQGGAVLFKDLCTSEWAMTPAEQALSSR